MKLNWSNQKLTNVQLAEKLQNLTQEELLEIKEINLEIQLLSKVLQYQLITKKQFKFKSSACTTGGY